MFGSGIEGVKTVELIEIACKINGTEYCRGVDPTQSLADFLRNELGLLGTKVSCGEGECGACTVIVNGKAINSCIMLAPEIDGCEVITIEGLSQTGELDPIQQAYIDEGAVQCGFCTPGMVMSTKALLMENSNPDEGEIRRALAGNLCRCTGYHRIVQAVKKAAQLKS